MLNGFTLKLLCALLIVSSAGAAITNEPNPIATETSAQQAIRELQEAHDALEEWNAPSTPHWSELEAFHQSLWRAMALDPTQPVIVPASEVPKALYSNVLTAELEKQLQAAKISPMGISQQDSAEWKAYLATAEEILKYRQERDFPEARAIAKRGKLDQDWKALIQKLETPDSPKSSVLEKISSSLSAIEALDQQQSIEQASEKSKNKLWQNLTFGFWALATALGFGLGFLFKTVSHRLIPRRRDLTAPTQNQKSEKPVLDYSSWLQELETQLTRYKTIQMAQERRLIEILRTNERLVQQAKSLHADARIQNEANLELRTGVLVRDIEFQWDQSQKLAAQEKTSVTPVIEHCLQLCDAIEADQIPKASKKSA